MNIDQAKEIFGVQNENERVKFARIPHCVIRDRSISVQAKDVYCYLIARCMTDSPYTWISQETMSIDLEVSGRNIRRHLAELQKRGLIKICKEKKNSRNVYMIRDVVEVYGKNTVNAPWPKRAEYEAFREEAPDKSVLTPPDKSVLTPPLPTGQICPHPEDKSVLQRRIRRRIRSVERERSKISEILPNGGEPAGSLSSTQTQIEIYPKNHIYASVFQNLAKIAKYRQKFNLGEQEEFLVDIMSEFSLNKFQLETLSFQWQEYHNGTNKEPSSPNASFRSWVKNEWRNKNEQGRKPKFEPSKIDYDSLPDCPWLK